MFTLGSATQTHLDEQLDLEADCNESPGRPLTPRKAAVFTFALDTAKEAAMPLEFRNILFAIIALALVSTSSSTAFGLVVKQQTHPRLIRKAGQPVRLLFSDGREARLETNLFPSLSVDVPFEVTEVVCPSARAGLKCTIKSPIEYQGYRLTWAKTVGASKRGEILRGLDDVALTNEELWTIGHVGLYPQLLPKFGDFDLSCDDFSWLPDSATTGKRAAPAELEIISWSSELMRENLELQTTDNMAVAGAYGMHFKSVDKKTLRFSSADHWVGKDIKASLKGFLVGDVVSLVIPARDQNLCQIVVKPGFQAGIDDSVAQHRKQTAVWSAVTEGPQSQRFDISNSYAFFMYHIEHGLENQFK